MPTAGRKVKDVLGFALAFRGLLVVTEAHDCPGVGDIDVVVMKGDAEWPLQAGCKNVALLRGATMLWVAQHQDFICTRFGNKNVAVRRGSQKTRVFELLGKDADVKAVGNRRQKTLRRC